MPPPGHDERLEAVRPQIGKHLQHRLVDEVRIGPLEPGMARATNPFGDDGRELVGRIAGMRGPDDLQQPLLAGRADCFHVAFEDSLERLLLLPLRMLRGHRPDPVKGEGNLEVDRLFRPERAVVVERGDAFCCRHKIRAAFARHASDEVDDGFLGGALVPRGHRVRLCLGDRRGDWLRGRIRSTAAGYQREGDDDCPGLHHDAATSRE